MGIYRRRDACRREHTALRCQGAKEETGIAASESALRQFATYQRNNYFQDLFLLNRDVNIANVILQPDETIAAQWASVSEILQMIGKGEFVHSAGMRFQMYRELVSQSTWVSSKY